jgi:hypothetical protein
MFSPSIYVAFGQPDEPSFPVAEGALETFGEFLPWTISMMVQDNGQSD